MSLIGNQKMTIDEKSRLRIPVQYRDTISQDFVLAKGPRGSYYILKKEDGNELIKKLQDRINNLTIEGDDEKVLELADLVSGIDVPVTDEQGRFLLRDDIKRFMNIVREVVFVGFGNKIIMWSLEGYTEYMTSREQHDERTRSIGKQIESEKEKNNS